MKCVLILFSFFETAVDLADENIQTLTVLLEVNDRIEGKFTILFDGYRKMFDQSFSKSNDLGVMLKFLPGVVVQIYMSVQGMADLYRI